MILDTSQNQLSKIFKKNEMGIKVDGLAHQMMIDGIYSNKLNSVFREISTNARDSHIEAGNENPFEIKIETTPNSKNCTVTITDYGTGLSEEEVLNYLCNLNSSSKRNSDSVVGCFGIGSKSVFSLTDKYTYECIKDGKLTNLLLTKDRSGTPNFSHRVNDTNLPNSVVCTFAVEENCKKILEAIYVELTLFDIKPVIKILRNPSDSFTNQLFVDHNSTNLCYEPEDFFPVIKEYDHYFIVDQRKVMLENLDYFDHKHLSCGVIGYKLDNYSTTTNYNFNKKVRGIGILPKFDLGEIKFGVSREIIENTSDTLNLLASKYIDIFKTYPEAQNITNFLKVEGNHNVFRYGRERQQVTVSQVEKDLLLDPYKPTSTSPEESVMISRLNLDKDFFVKDYLTNKINFQDPLDKFLLGSFFNKDISFFKLIDQIPTPVLQKNCNDKNVSLTDLYTFYTTKVNHYSQKALEYYNNTDENKARKLILLNDILASTLSRKGIKYNMFYYKVSDENKLPVYVYSHKSFGSNAFLEKLTHKDVNIIKFSRAQDIEIINFLMPFLNKIYDIESHHLDDYKVDHPEFYNSIRPVRVPKTVTTVTSPEGIIVTAEPENLLSEQGLRLRYKHELCSLRIQDSWQSANRPVAELTEYKDDTAMTSTQLYTRLNSLNSNGIDIIYVSKDLAEDPTIFDTLKSRFVLILESEQSDPEEILKIVRLIKGNYNNTYFINKVLNKEFIDELPATRKAFLIDQATVEYFQDLDNVAATLGTEFKDIIKNLTMRRYLSSNFNHTISQMYFNKNANNLIEFLIENMDKFKLDFLNITYLKELVSHYKNLIYSQNMVESITTLKQEMMNDN